MRFAIQAPHFHFCRKAFLPPFTKLVFSCLISERVTCSGLRQSPHARFPEPSGSGRHALGAHARPCPACATLQGLAAEALPALTCRRGGLCVPLRAGCDPSRPGLFQLTLLSCVSFLLARDVLSFDQNNLPFH